MNLKDFLASPGKTPELYWSLVLEKGVVQAGIWYIGATALEMLNISPPAFWATESELISACDAALSSAVATLPENYAEPNKTVFGVPATWVKNGEISDEYIALVKEACSELSLTPVGFVVIPEAIAHLYKSEEGTPLSAIIVGLGNESLEVSVFKLGNLAGTTSVARSISIIDDVTEGLSRFEGAAPLPSRIIVYDGKDNELTDAKEELMKASWEGEGKVKFLHTPKAEILLSDRKVLATSLAGAAEIGNVTQVNSNITPDVIEPEVVESVLPPKEEIENIEEPDMPVSAEDLGFVVDTPKVEPYISPQTLPSQEKAFSVNTKKFGIGVKSLFHSLKITRKPTGAIYFIAVFIALLIISVGLFLWFVPRATVTIYVSPKTYQQQVSLSFNLDDKFDESQAIIPGVAITATANGSKTKSTTGTKLIGERAKGSVQIVNGNGNPINLAAGTILTSTGGLKFVTDQSASVSGQLIPGSPGTATLSVTSNDLGAQYNLAKSEVFKVGLFDKSQVAATSQADFSGGSSQQIAAVSADDQKKLEADLKQELSGQVLSGLNAKVDSDQVFINDLSSLSISSETFDHKIGDTVDTLKLALTVSGSGVAADKGKLLQYATDSLKSKIPSGYALRSSQIAFKFTYIGNKNGNLGYNADIVAKFVPLVTTDDLGKQIAGKKTTAVVEYLSKVPGYDHADVKISPQFVTAFKFMPRVLGNIKIDVVPEE